MTPNSLTPESARKLATEVAKQSDGVSVKIGETNGKPVLHLVNRHLPSREASVNVTCEADWSEHPWNKNNAPRQKGRREIDGLNEAIANKEAQ